MLSFYNTLTRSKQVFTPINPPYVKLYTCGPTVYNFAHIGNFRTYVFEDILRRTLKHFGYQVEQVMNITDVDDKTIRGAIKEGISLEAYTAPFTKAFLDDLETLGIEAVEHLPRATAFIPEMIKMIEVLLEKKIAYIGSDGSVYFSIEKFPAYGALSHLKIEELAPGASERINQDEYDKESASDFVLWKAYEQERDGEIFWESPWGKGRPGWHIECSAMSTSILGPKIDIHCGAVDNIFPHHENEIAQSECCTGVSFVNFWLHSEHLVVEGKKMSKSEGNFYTLRDLLEKGFTGREIRYLLLSVPYRTKLNFTIDGLEAARQALKRIDDFVDRLKGYEPKEDSKSDEAFIAIQEAESGVDRGMGDDLNTSVALASLFDFIRKIHHLLDSSKIGKIEKEKTLAFIKYFDNLLRISESNPSSTIPSEIIDAFEKRQQARKNKDWLEADRLRRWIESKHFLIEDGPDQSRLKRRAHNPFNTL